MKFWQVACLGGIPVIAIDLLSFAYLDPGLAFLICFILGWANVFFAIHIASDF
jgi:hypothetical protein